MAKKQTLTATTSAGTFTRTTASDYKFVTVWNSPRAMRAALDHINGAAHHSGGVHGRWVKDGGFGVTWHFTRPSPKSYLWDSEAKLVGVFEVMAA